MTDSWSCAGNIRRMERRESQREEAHDEDVILEMGTLLDITSCSISS
jgi:hypothetical protein